MERWAGNDFAPATDVLPGAETYLGTRDRLILGDTLLLRLSGKCYLAEPAAPTERVPDLQSVAWQVTWDEPSATQPRDLP